MFNNYTFIRVFPSKSFRRISTVSARRQRGVHVSLEFCNVRLGETRSVLLVGYDRAQCGAKIVCERAGQMLLLERHVARRARNHVGERHILGRHRLLTLGLGRLLFEQKAQVGIAHCRLARLARAQQLGKVGKEVHIGSRALNQRRWPMTIAIGMRRDERRLQIARLCVGIGVLVVIAFVGGRFVVCQR